MRGSKCSSSPAAAPDRGIGHAEGWASVFLGESALPAAIVADDLENSQEKGKRAGGKASHGEHEGQPPRVRVGTLASDSAEEDVNGDGAGEADSEDPKAGAENFARIRLEKAGWHEIRTCLS